MGDLAAFILARIAEDEVAARAATPGPWECFGDHLVWPSEKGPAANDPILAIGAAHEDSVAHVVANDPATTLRRCAVLRAIVERCGAIDPREDDYPLADNVLCALASIWADHESFDPAWRLG